MGGSVSIDKEEFRVLMNELEQKQSIIARQQAQVDKRIDSIQDLTKELLKLRESMGEHKQKREELMRELSQNQEAAKVSIRQEEIAGVPREALIKSYTDLGARHQVEVNRLEEYKGVFFSICSFVSCRIMIMLVVATKENCSALAT